MFRKRLVEFRGSGELREASFRRAGVGSSSREEKLIADEDED